MALHSPARFLPKLLLLTVVFFLAVNLFAQPLSWMGKPKPYKWMLGIGWQAIDDDGRPFCQPFDVNQSWHAEMYPTRLFVDRYLKHGLSLNLTAGYTTYKARKLVNDTIGLSGMFLAVDINCSYSFRQFIAQRWFDPYVSLGAGLTHRDTYPGIYTGTANVAVGVNLWFTKSWGLQLQSTGKFGIGAGFGSSKSNYLQHSAGIVYKFPPKKQHQSNHKKRYKWTKSREKYKGGRNG